MVFVRAIEAFDYSGAGKNKRNAIFAAVPSDSMSQMLSNRADFIAPATGIASS
jgi:hypothetical protein